MYFGVALLKLKRWRAATNTVQSSTQTHDFVIPAFAGMTT
jgi:hypothetical protein